MAKTTKTTTTTTSLPRVGGSSGYQPPKRTK